MCKIEKVGSEVEDFQIFVETMGRFAEKAWIDLTCNFIEKYHGGQWEVRSINNIPFVMIDADHMKNENGLFEIGNTNNGFNKPMTPVAYGIGLSLFLGSHFSFQNNELGLESAGYYYRLRNAFFSCEDKNVLSAEEFRSIIEFID